MVVKNIRVNDPGGDLLLIPNDTPATVATATSETSPFIVEHASVLPLCEEQTVGGRYGKVFPTISTAQSVQCHLSITIHNIVMINVSDPRSN